MKIILVLFRVQALVRLNDDKARYVDVVKNGGFAKSLTDCAIAVDVKFTGYGQLINYVSFSY